MKKLVFCLILNCFVLFNQVSQAVEVKAFENHLESPVTEWRHVFTYEAQLYQIEHFFLWMR